MVRLKQLSAALQSAVPESDAMLITHPVDVRYLTGFTGSNAAIFLPVQRPGKTRRHTPLAKPVLFTDGRYIQQAKQETKHAGVVIAQGPILREACASMVSAGIRHCAIDGEHTTLAALDGMRRWIPSKLRRNFFKPVLPLTAGLREIKDIEEIGRIRAAAQLGCRLFEDLLTQIEPRKREVDVAAHLEFAARMAGADGMSFETIVASGARSALPHGHATEQRMPRRGFVVLDFGVLLRGYCSDMTRTVHLGPATSTERNGYEAVLEAQLAAIASVKPGVQCGDVDEAARSVLRRAKLADFFTHSTGHGVGMEIHEDPRIAARQQQRLRPGMVITIEPGIYLPGRFGIRIEDMLLVTRNGAEILTSATKAWIEL
ncbi:MAG TPA: aminopeptidase P family protein [Acidobacteriaceae bacterium]|nr:aminopeptidase P family protein [Acidobacteriaceae bacterium]